MGEKQNQSFKFSFNPSFRVGALQMNIVSQRRKQAKSM